MKNPILLLLATASLAAAQTRTVTVNPAGELVYPDTTTFLQANDLPSLSGNNSFSGSLVAEGIFRSGDLRWEEALEEIFTITVNGTATDLHTAGAEIYTDFGNVISVVEDGGLFYWSDENHWWWVGRSQAWNSPTEGAAALRAIISSFDPNWDDQYPYITSGEGSVCRVTFAGQNLNDWASSSTTLLPIETIQDGRSSGWQGAGVLLSPSGNVTFSGSFLQTSAPLDPPILAQTSDQSTDVGNTWIAKGWAISGDSSPLIGSWTSPGQSSMALGFGGYPDSQGDNLGARPWTAKNSSYVGRLLYLGSEGNWAIDSSPSNVWQTQNWGAMRGWGFHYAGSVVSGQAMPGGFSTRSLILDNAEPSSTNPGAYFWSSHSAVLWNANIGTNKREIRLKFFGSPTGGYGARAELATRVIASTEWTASRWRGTGTTDPASPQDGDLFFRTDTTKVRIYAAGAWRDLN
jgi:hypothetical protein